MPQPGKCWRHVTISTLSSWLPGDPRGWRSRQHKTHSSGDYKSIPPDGEHDGLHRYAVKVSGEPVIIPPHLQNVVGESIRESLSKHQRVLVIAVAGMHTHILVELPIDAKEARKIIGDAKNLSSRHIRQEMPGRVWAGGGDYKIIKDATHQARVYSYIRDHVHQSAWVWTFREGVVNVGD